MKVRSMDNYTIAKEIIAGKWGNGDERKQRIIAAGYNYDIVQGLVNILVDDMKAPPLPEVTEKKPPLEVEYDIRSNDGIIINIVL